MDAYREFARVYDLFMDNIPYEEWSRYLIGLLREYGIRDGLVAELGCGTGSMTELLASAGYDMIGIDLSEEMLEEAMEKKEQSGHDILYLCQDMREFELYGTVRAIVSVCDSMNYVLEEEELLHMLTLAVRNYLDYEGLFIFDLNTRYKYREILGEQTIAENREEGSFIWENYYDEESGINEYDLTLYIAASDGRYSRFMETHYQRGYSLEQVKDCLAKAGMEFIAGYDGFSRDPLTAQSERMTILAREKGKRI